MRSSPDWWPAISAIRPARGGPDQWEGFYEADRTAAPASGELRLPAASVGAHEHTSRRRQGTAVHECAQDALASGGVEIEQPCGLRNRQLQPGHFHEFRANEDMEVLMTPV